MTERFVKTQAEVAMFFGVSVDAIKLWRRNGCPGPKKRGGPWALSAIAKWKIARIESNRPDAPTTPAKQRLFDIKAAVEAQKLKAMLRKEQEAMGDLINVDEVGDLIVRMINEHNTHAEQIVDRVLGVLPRNMKSEDRKRVLSTIEKAVDDLRNVMADLGEQWAAEFEGDGVADDDEEESE